MARPYVSLRFLSACLGISYDTARAMRDNGDLPPAVRLGARQYYPVSRLIERFPELSLAGCENAGIKENTRQDRPAG